MHVVTASNPYVDPEQKTSDVSIMYIDENNLYGNALCMKLPVGKFYMFDLNDKNPNSINWQTIDTEGDIGYLLEVDLEYPESIHDATQHFPLAPEIFEITHELLSTQMKTQLETLNKVRGVKNHPMKSCKKLVANCFNKKNYAVHFKVLKFYLQKGLKITYIHNVVSFHQEHIYKNYIDANTKLRTLATNDFDKSYYKQINNSLFGKSMEDVRNRMKVHVVGEPYTYQNFAGKPHFLGCHLNTKLG